MMPRRIVSKKFLLLLCLVLTFTLAVGPSLAIFISRSPTFINRFDSGMLPPETGDLTISKLLDHPYGPDYPVPAGCSYTFRVELGENYAGQTVETSRGTLTADETGTLTVVLPYDGTITIYGIEAGIAVTVSETRDHINPGYILPEPQTVIIPAREDGTASVTMVNTYRPVSVEADGLTVRVEKLLAGRDWQMGDCFTFLLEMNRDGQWVELGRRTVTYDPENPDFNQLDFTPEVCEAVSLIRYNADGKIEDTCAFRIREDQAGNTIGGVTYDENISYFDVKVSDADLDGDLELESVTSASTNTTVEGYTVHITFVNEYAPEGSAQVVIRIIKLLEDLSGQGRLPEGFVFALYDQNGQQVAVSDATTTAGETAIRLVYTPEMLNGEANAEFDYILKEIDPGQPGLICDTTEYPIRVRITDNLDGTVSAVVWVVAPEQAEPPADAAAECAVTFRNVYDPADTEAEIGGEKHLSGRELKPGEFRFRLYATGENFGIAENAEPVQTVTNDENGRFAFDRLIFDRVGTYRYVVVEDATEPLGGVVYDTAVYHVTVTVTDTDGVLTAQTMVTDAAGDPADIVFWNRYETRPACVILRAEKEFLGGVLMCNAFAFDLYQADEAFQPQGDPIRHTRNLADGAIVFDSLTFQEPGTYYYVMVENTDITLDRVEYDRSVYGITVIVTDDGNGQLVADWTAKKLGVGPVEQIVFENQFTPDIWDPVILIPIQKIIVNLGREWIGPEGFRFQLENLDTGETSIVESNLLGETGFRLTYDESDVGNTYHYQITELNDGRSGVTYSTLVYSFRVTVSMSPEGQVLAALEMGGVWMPGFVAVFENCYDDGEEPTHPTCPEDPTDPSETLKPTQPSETTEPMETTVPDETTTPAETTEPTPPTESTQPSEPSDPTTPTGDDEEPTRPTEPTDQDEPTETSGVTEPAGPDAPPTGDENELMFYLILGMVGVAILILLAVTAKWNWESRRYCQ